MSKDIEFFRVDNVNMIKIKENVKEIFYLCPIYLNCNSWENDFEILSALMLNNPELMILIIGDMNIRAGNKQVLFKEMDLGCTIDLLQCRNSKDVICNGRGKCFLNFCDNYNLIILNGRTRGDRKGEFTFVGAQGSSVNDIACVTVSGLKYLYDFKVDKKHFSDHMPIVVELEFNKKGEKENIVPLLPRLKWKR